MDKMNTAVLCGEERELNYSIAVMFEAIERYGDVQTALNIMGGSDMAAFEAVRWFAVMMANDAELCRRAEGYEQRKMLTPDSVPLRMRPVEFYELQNAVVKAVSIGYGREILDANEDEDLGLAELNAKKTEAGA